MRKITTTFAILFSLGWSGMLVAGWDEGVAAFKAGKLQQALAEFQTVVEQQPDWPGGHLMVGQTLLKLNRPAEAERALRKSYDLNPNDANTQLLLGQTYVALQRYRDAVELLSKVKLDGMPKAQQALAYHLRGTAYHKTGNNEAAVGDLGRAVQLNPEDAGLQYLYGSLELSLGNTAEALGPLETAVRLDSGDNAKTRVYIQALLRSGRENRGDAKISAYRKASQAAARLASRDDSYDNILLLGEAQLGAKDYAGAVKSFGSASAKKPAEWLPNLYLGQAYTAMTQYDKAVAPLDTALGQAKSATDKKRIQRQLGFVYEKLKDFDRAINYYRQAGDSSAADRVAKNREIYKSNVQAEQEQEEYERLMAEEEELRKALEELPGGGG